MNVTAYPLTYEKRGLYKKEFTSIGYSILLEDDGETIYLYLTSLDFTEILDAMLIFDLKDKNIPCQGDIFHLVHNEDLNKIGLYYNDNFLAVIDIENKRAVCRSGVPEEIGKWNLGTHIWQDKFIEGF